MNRNQQDPLDKRAEIGKLGNSGAEFGNIGNHARIPRVAESRIPRLQNIGQRSANLNSVGERSEDSSNSDPLNLTLKKGMLWSQRKRLFSRWKEKYFILTPDYLHCFKKGGSKISEMGAFDYKVRLADIERIELEDRKGYYTINLHLKGEESILLRRVEASRDWYTAINQAANTSRERRKEMLSAREFWSKKQFTDTESIQSYVQTRYRGVSETPSSHLYRRGMSPSSGYSPSSTPSPSPRLNSISPNPLSPRIISPSPLLSSSVISSHLPHHYPSPNLAHQHQHYFSPQLNNYSTHLNNYSTHIINSPPTIEQDSGIDSLLTSLSDTSSNYSHRRIISPR
ncbi:uncharacterized protein LOC111712175 [Eurytemora carolleeae]|uniref:uncharacterized protein LOC111712175 n=1 Tax=Eurytemora carolleeae TaxID=1294199 RepID=UPI000C7646A4|nr:uncharacterized protein LOC111712175 [Eurytemora carolleeae]|eukprot:XP_023342489.1 uncharacterized protein LOC111712175 [Eurytemora affinis]